MAEHKHSGGCMCGAVRYEVVLDVVEASACHCEMCRKWTGGPYMAIHCKNEVSFTGEDYISVYKSSAWAERGFCKKCGSSLFYRMPEKNEYGMAAGSFDAQDFTLSVQYFTDKKPEFYSFAEETRNLTEAKIFALYAPKDD